MFCLMAVSVAAVRLVRRFSVSLCVFFNKKFCLLLCFPTEEGDHCSGVHMQNVASGEICEEGKLYCNLMTHRCVRKPGAY